MLITQKRSTRLDWVANGRRTTISYYGTHEQAKADAHKASKQIDGLEPGETSPVQNGASDGSFHLPMDGPKEFTKDRHRPGWKGTTTEMKRELHSVPLKKGGVL